MSSATGRPARPPNAGRPNAPRPKKGVQRRKESNANARAPTPVFVPRNAIADPRIPRPQRKTAACANPNCVKPEIVDDNGTKVCATCGTVAQESNIVAEITFGESSTGAAVVQGTFVGAGQRHGRGGPGPRGFHTGEDGPNRQQTMNLAKTIISGIIPQLGLLSGMTDQAINIFTLTHVQMVQGRSIRAVAAVCLYVACRRKANTNAHHVMLIDIAEVLNFNVFMLGSIYTKMVRILRSENLDMVNPENLILRFARSLEFGRETNRIVGEATRLVQRMKRDWMVTGRRPAGVCGAALIIAARMNNFRRTVREMVYVVKVTEVTINKRLEEFKVTDTSKFTVEEFRNTDILDPSLKEHDPPAFYQAQEGYQPKRKRGRPKKQAETAAEIEGVELEDNNEDESPPAQRRRIDKDGFAIPDIPIDPALRASATSQDGPIDEALTSAVNNAISEMERDQSSRPASDGAPSAREDMSDTASIASTDTSASGSTTISETTGLPRKRGRGRPKGAKNKGPLPLSEAELALEAAIENEVRSSLEEIAQESERIQQAPKSTAQQASHQQQPTPPNTQPEPEPPSTEAESGASSSTQPVDQESTTNRKIRMTQDIDPSEFDDDPEVANCLLTTAEREIKERIWVHENNTWLREQHRKKIRAEIKQADPSQQPQSTGLNAKKRKKRGRLGDPSYLKESKENEASQGGGAEEGAEAGDDIQASIQQDLDSSTAAARSMKAMLDHRGFSSRLNYQNMQTLFPDMDFGEEKEDGRKKKKKVDQGSRSQTQTEEETSSRAETPAEDSSSAAGATTPQQAVPSPSPSAQLQGSQSNLTAAANDEEEAADEDDDDDQDEPEAGDGADDVDPDLWSGESDEGEDEDVEEAFAGRYPRREDEGGDGE